MLTEKVVYLSIAISLFGSFFFIKDILAGRARPNLVTWFFWALAPLVGTFLQDKAGAGLSVLPVFLAGFFPLIIFFIALSQKNSYWKITNFDILCGVFALISLILWVLTRNTDISILFAISADALAAVPTLIKSWKYPETETAIGYVPGIFNNILGLLVIKEWDFSIYSFGVYFIVLNTTLVIFIIRKKIFLNKVAI
ncbi:hypothetical protein HZA26_03035 [Candidatus Nomurabacteria bacterium]|nr:hypothetical protein [Candidatus Nomurabacteria bacterium]